MQQILPSWLLTNKQTIANKKCKIVVSGKEKQKKRNALQIFSPENHNTSSIHVYRFSERGKIRRESGISLGSESIKGKILFSAHNKKASIFFLLELSGPSHIPHCEILGKIQTISKPDRNESTLVFFS